MFAPTEIPTTVRALLWEYDTDAFDWTEVRDLVIKRVLSAGRWDDVRWLRDRIGDEALRTWIEDHEGGDLSPRQLRFWELVLGLRSDRVDDWVRCRRDSIWGRRTLP